jgi:hypothetical protein
MLRASKTKFTPLISCNQGPIAIVILVRCTHKLGSIYGNQAGKHAMIYGFELNVLAIRFLS